MGAMCAVEMSAPLSGNRGMLPPYSIAMSIVDPKIFSNIL